MLGVYRSHWIGERRGNFFFPSHLLPVPIVYFGAATPSKKMFLAGCPLEPRGDPQMRGCHLSMLVSGIADYPTPHCISFQSPLYLMSVLSRSVRKMFVDYPG